MKQMTNRALSLLLALALCFSLIVVSTPAVQAADYTTQWWEQYQDVTADDARYNPSAPGVDTATGKVNSGDNEWILFTSDTHSNGYLAKDLLDYANSVVQTETGDDAAYVGLFAFGGDFADSGLLPEVMTMLHVAIETASPNTVAVYTKGNHENDYNDEQFQAITGMPRVGETALNENYHFYSFGMTENQTFTQTDIDNLETYLSSLRDDKPVFVISHFPIHYLNSMRSVYGAGAKELLDVLNQYPQVVFSWGHNHSEADPSYGTVRFPGETLTYGPNQEDTVELNFTYMSNGSLRYGNNEENGVLVKVNEDGSMDFRFIDLNMYAVDDREWTDSADATFETLVAGTPQVWAYVSRDYVDADYYSVINAAQAFVARPKVGNTPATAADVTVYSQRYEVSDIAWTVDNEPLTATEFDFSTAYTATVTLAAKAGYTFAEDLINQHTTGINPSYKGPMGETYSVGVSQVERVSDTEVKIDYTFEMTAEGYNPPVEPATEIISGHRYVLASNDSTAVATYYQYAYQAGARRQNYRASANDVVIRDGKLASKSSDFETWTAIKDGTGYLLYSDASLVAHADGDNSIATINILNLYVRGGTGEMDSSPGDIYTYNNWNIDESGLPYINTEGHIYYPLTSGTNMTCTEDPAECNMRLYDVGEDTSGRAYIVEANVTAPVTGEAPEATNADGNSVTWSPADETFQPDTEYTATVTVTLDAPLADLNAAIGRMNGRDVDLTVSEDGMTATVSFTFTKTNKESVPAADVVATKASALEDGKTYVILVDGKVMTSKKSDDGRFLLGEEITVADDQITEGINTDMLFTVEAKGDGLFYIKSDVDGYLIGRKETDDAMGTWGIDFTTAPAMVVGYDGGLYVDDTGVPAKMSFGKADPTYFYLYDGHINDSETEENADAVVLYEVTEVEPVAPPVKTGWEQVDGVWNYYDADGNMVTSKWVQDNDKWYYMDENGTMKTGWLESGTSKYYLKSSGAMATGWTKLDGKWYYFAKSGAMKTGWVKVDEKWYYLDANGIMKTGWVKVDEKWYFLDTNGTMKTGWLESGTSKYYLKSSGAMATGWTKLEGKWYYFAKSGAMFTSKWIETDGKWYYLSKNGTMATSTWVNTSGDWYYLKSSGVMATNESLTIKGTSYSFDANGVCTNP